MMQHKFPFFVLHFLVDGETVDVNVHPTKMELRFQKQQAVYDAVFEAIHRRLLDQELIPQVTLPEPKQPEKAKRAESKSVSAQTEVGLRTERSACFQTNFPAGY